MNQAPPLEVQHLLRLREINVIDRIGAGAFLVCVYSLARRSDLRYVHHIKFDGCKRQAPLDIYTSEHKTSAVGLRREQFLLDWIGTYLQLCVDQGFNFERVPFGPLLPAPKGENERYSRCLGANEGAGCP